MAEPEPFPCPVCEHGIDSHGSLPCDVCADEWSRNAREHGDICRALPSDIARALLTAEPTDAEVLAASKEWVAQAPGQSQPPRWADVSTYHQALVTHRMALALRAARGAGMSNEKVRR